MPRRCEGMAGRAGGGLSRCVYDAWSGDRYCYWHRSVVDGRITSGDPRWRDGALSWRPNKPMPESIENHRRSTERAEDPAAQLRALRAEWDLGEAL
ncbi:MAG TPA: hypothetical protein VNO79_06955 [Actinomycetota bacterium]|nr:hypothetical protein [Actinomycetota bacterium]